MITEKNPRTRTLYRRLLALEDSLRGKPFPGMSRAKQITVYHCGPAVVEALFSFLNVKVNQRALVRSLRLNKKIVLYGLTIQELAKAVKVAGHGKYSFWRKTNSRLSDINKIINKYKYPVGVEWQGVFYEFEDEDSGHYSIVTKFDTKTSDLRISDPFRAFSGVDRKFKIKEFRSRWWDENEISVEGLKKRRKVTDYRALFVITPKAETWPKKLGLKKV